MVVVVEAVVVVLSVVGVGVVVGTCDMDSGSVKK